MQSRLSHHLHIHVGQGARGGITAFARPLVVTPSATLLGAAAWHGIDLLWLFTVFTLFYIAFNIGYNISIMKPGKKPFTSKICPICGIEKLRSEYYKKGNTVSHSCKPCSLKQSKERAHLYIGKYSEYRNAWKRAQTALDTPYNQRRKTLKSAQYDLKKDTLNEKRRLRTSTNHEYRAYCRELCARRRMAQPRWVDSSELRAFYLGCPDGFEVDHIVPLNGKVDGRPVRGLHVLWNLQYLPAHENRKKYCLITESDIA